MHLSYNPTIYTRARLFRQIRTSLRECLMRHQATRRAMERNRCWICASCCACALSLAEDDSLRLLLFAYAVRVKSSLSKRRVECKRTNQLSQTIVVSNADQNDATDGRHVVDGQAIVIFPSSVSGVDETSLRWNT